MVRASSKKIQNSAFSRRTAKFKLNKVIVNSKNGSDVSASKITNNIGNRQENPLNDNDNSSYVKKTTTVPEIISVGTSKNNAVLINKNGVSNAAEAKRDSISKSKIASILQRITVSRVLPSKVIVYKLVDIPKETETDQTSPVVCSNDVPLSVENEHNNNCEMKIASVPVKSKHNNNYEIKIASIQSLVSQQTVPPTNTEKSTQIKEQSGKKFLRILPKCQIENVQPKESKDNGPSIQKSVRSRTNVQQNDQNVNVGQSIPQKDQNASTKSDNFQKIQTVADQILNTKYLPIKPKPPGYQPPRPLFVTPPKKSRVLFTCTVCEKKFTRAHNLFQHQKRAHKAQVFSGKRYDCRVCGKALANPQSRYKHEKFIHSAKCLKNKPYFKCPECLQDFKGKKYVKEHLAKDHTDINLEPQNITFNSYEDFEKWRESVERDTASQYVIRCRLKMQAWERLEFNCHRSSPIHCTFKTSRKRKMKFKGSNKTGLFCPAFIVARIYATSVEVAYNLTHLGHECDVEHISMDKRISDHNCKLLRCRVCKRVFSTSANRRKHEMTAHEFDVKYELTLKCPLCFDVFPSRKLVMYHVSKFHGEIDLKTTQLMFESSKDFDKWKLTTEQETNSKYVLDQVYQKGLHSVRRFNCHLSGSGENELFCPANILIKFIPKEKCINVTYLSTHVGHDQEAMHKSSSDMNSVIDGCISIEANHKAAENIFRSVNAVKKCENTWTLLPLKNENCSYEVKRLNVDCTHTCKFKCSSCNFCSHEFTCSCSTSLSNLMCIHIHIVCLKNNLLNDENISDNSSMDVNDNEQEDGNELENVLQEITVGHELNSLKEQAMSELSVLLTEISNCNDGEKLRCLINDLSNIKNKIH